VPPADQDANFAVALGAFKKVVGMRRLRHSGAILYLRSRAKRGGEARRAPCSLWFFIYRLAGAGRCGLLVLRFHSPPGPACAAGASRARNEPGAPLRRPARGAGAERFGRGRTATEQSGGDGARGLRGKPVGRRAAPSSDSTALAGAVRSGRILTDERSEEHHV
jgi:hypothetical protein